MNQYLASEKKFDKQMAAGYIAYMIVGSYFAEAKCLNPVLEKQMMLHYREMSVNTQIEKEKLLISLMERLDKNVRSSLDGLCCDVSIRRLGGKWLLIFYTGLENVGVLINEKGHISLAAA